MDFEQINPLDDDSYSDPLVEEALLTASEHILLLDDKVKDLYTAVEGLLEVAKTYAMLFVSMTEENLSLSSRISVLEDEVEILDEDLTRVQLEVDNA